MDISDIRTRVEVSPNEKNSLITKISEVEEPPILTLVDRAEQSDAEFSKLPDPLVQALVNKLPKPDSIWSLEDRAKWLRAAAMAFNLVYKPDESGDADLKIEGKPSVLKSAG